jgi:hypothetical protein
MVEAAGVEPVSLKFYRDIVYEVKIQLSFMWFVSKTRHKREVKKSCSGPPLAHIKTGG